MYALFILFLVNCSDHEQLYYDISWLWRRVGTHSIVLSKIIRNPIYKLERRYSWLSVRSFCRRPREPTTLFLKSTRVYKSWTKCFDARQHSERRARFRSGLSEKIECDCFDRIFQDILIQKDSKGYMLQFDKICFRQSSSSALCFLHKYTSRLKSPEICIHKFRKTECETSDISKPTRSRWKDQWVNG